MYEHARDALAALVAEGHSESFIATALNRRRVPTATGRGGWHGASVRRACAVLGLPVPRYTRAAH
jgi:hypothetical protein